VTAVVLLSGGADSSVMLALAKKKHSQILALSFSYGQRHAIELESAKKIAAHYQVDHQVLELPQSQFHGSALTNQAPPPKGRSLKEVEKSGIAPTYVPARNLLFLSFAVGQAELYDAEEIYFGPNAHDHHNYPDCCPAFVEAMQAVTNLATKTAREKTAPQIITPLIHLNKAEIFSLGLELGVPFEKTFSCYDPQEGKPCGSCDSCTLRREAFAFAKRHIDDSSLSLQEFIS